MKTWRRRFAAPSPCAADSRGRLTLEQSQALIADVLAMLATSLAVNERSKALDEGPDPIPNGLIGHTSIGIEHFPSTRDVYTSFEPRPHTERSHHRQPRRL